MRAVLASLAAALFLVGAQPAVAQPAVAQSAVAQSEPKGSEQPRIVLGQVGLSFYAVVGGVVQELLEREGFEVELVEAPHAEIFPRLGAGEIDILAAAWLPGGHAALYAPVEDATFQVARIYEDARFFWVVPSYVPESEVASIADLSKPEVRGRMLNRIVSLPEATGLTTGGRRVMAAYDLEAAGYQLVAGSPAEWLGAFREAVENEDWVVFPLWQPQWVNATYDVRRLEEPRQAYGDPDSAYLIGHDALRDKLPEATLSLLANIRFPVEAVTEMDRMVNVDGLSPREAARRWMAENAETVEAWSGNQS